MMKFNDCPVDPLRTYLGANGSKIGITIDGIPYMLKIESRPRKNPAKGYTNSCFSEHIACKVIQSIGLPAQETILGTYEDIHGEKTAVACRDFTFPDYRLAEFASIKNTLTASDSNGYGTELSEIEETMDHQQFCEPQKVREFFWDMFICDAFIGNFDRHNGNWGFIFQRESRETAFAPIYDCGSSLYPQLQIKDYRSVLDNPDEIKNRILVFPTSAIKINGSKINYCGFISSHENENCDKALKRIVPRIHMDKIGSMISDMEELSDIQKEFYITMLTKRKELILDPNFEQL